MNNAICGVWKYQPSVLYSGDEMLRLEMSIRDDTSPDTPPLSGRDFMCLNEFAFSSPNVFLLANPAMRGFLTQTFVKSIAYMTPSYSPVTDASADPVVSFRLMVSAGALDPNLPINLATDTFRKINDACKIVVFNAA